MLAGDKVINEQYEDRPIRGWFFNIFTAAGRGYKAFSHAYHANNDHFIALLVAPRPFYFAPPSISCSPSFSV